MSTAPGATSPLLPLLSLPTEQPQHHRAQRHGRGSTGMALRGLTQPPKAAEPHPPGEGSDSPRGQSPPPPPRSPAPPLSPQQRPSPAPQAAGSATGLRAVPGLPSSASQRARCLLSPSGRRQDAGAHHGGGWRWILRGGGVTAMAAATALSRWRAQSGRKRTLTSTAPFLYDGAGRGAEHAHPALRAHARPRLSGLQRPAGSMVGRTVPPGRDHVAAHRGCTGTYGGLRPAAPAPRCRGSARAAAGAKSSPSSAGNSGGNRPGGPESVRPLRAVIDGQGRGR